MGKTYHGLEGLAELRKDAGLPEIKKKEPVVNEKKKHYDDHQPSAEPKPYQKGKRGNNKVKYEPVIDIGEKKKKKKNKNKKNKSNFTSPSSVAAAKAEMKKQKEQDALHAQEMKKTVELGYAIKCPRHKSFLSKGRKGSLPIPASGNESIVMFYCPQCRQYYFSSHRLSFETIAKFGNVKAKNINTSLYMRENGTWVRMGNAASGINSPKGGKIVVGKESEEDKQRKAEAQEKAQRDIARAKIIEKRFNPKSDTLYIHKGMIICLKNKHDVISVRLSVPTEEKGRDGIVNANYCFDCDKFFMSLDEYNTYQKRNQIMLVRFQFLEGTTYDSYSYQWAEKSPLMLAGYSVSATKGYSDEKRRKILSVIIENGIVEKHEVIKYINFFISTKKNQPQYTEAISKWNKDLDFVRNYRIEQQHSSEIKTVKQYR